MKNSNDSAVQSLLDQTALVEPEKYAMLQAMRKIVFDLHPTVAERIMYGGIMFSVDKLDFGGLFLRKNHISFEFGNGHAMKDPDNHLEGTGQSRRHLKLRTMGDIDKKSVRSFASQAI